MEDPVGNGVNGVVVMGRDTARVGTLEGENVVGVVILERLGAVVGTMLARLGAVVVGMIFVMDGAGDIVGCSDGTVTFGIVQPHVVGMVEIRICKHCNDEN
jgi:hypothetical protein